MRAAIKLICIALIIVALTAPGVMPVQAQGEIWHFGWDNDSGAMVAYNSSGITQPLMTIDPDVPPVGWRLGPDRALAILSSGGVPGLYQLTSGGAAQVQPLFGAEVILPQLSQLAAFNGQYAVLVAESGAFGVGAIVDLNGNTVEVLSGEVLIPIENWRFSADGSTLRYISREARDSDIWNIWERDLVSGDERSLFSITSAFPIIQPNPDGSVWLYRVLQAEPRAMIYTTIFSDGTSQVLAQENLPPPDSSAPFTTYQIAGGRLLVYSAPCEGACSIESRPLAGGSPQSFAISRIAAPQMSLLAQVDESRLLVQIEDGFWLLNAGAEATQPGTYSAVSIFTPADRLVSADGQWLFALNGPTQYRLWHLPTGNIALEGEVAQGVEVTHAAAGTIISQFEPRRARYYRYLDGQQFELPLGEADFYVDTLADGGLLYAQTREEAGRAPGVYRYEPDSGSYTLLVTNLFPLILR
jgi:hypothetical protein